MRVRLKRTPPKPVVPLQVMTIHYDAANPWSTPPAGHAQPGLQALMAYLTAHYGGSNNGIYVNRAMRGSGSPSLHRDGRALDWLQPDDAKRAAGAAFCVENAEALQVQAVHRYKEGLAWRPDKGWHRVASDSTGWGQPWANWIHVERNLTGSKDARTIDEILHVHANPAKPDPPAPITSTPIRGTNMQLSSVDIALDSGGNGFRQTTIPWSKFIAATHQGSNPDPSADGAYWPGQVHAQQRDGNVLVSVTGASRQAGHHATVYVAHA